MSHAAKSLTRKHQTRITYELTAAQSGRAMNLIA